MHLWFSQDYIQCNATNIIKCDIFSWVSFTGPYKSRFESHVKLFRCLIFKQPFSWLFYSVCCVLIYFITTNWATPSNCLLCLLLPYVFTITRYVLAYECFSFLHAAMSSIHNLLFSLDFTVYFLHIIIHSHSLTT